MQYTNPSLFCSNMKSTCLSVLLAAVLIGSCSGRVYDVTALGRKTFVAKFTFGTISKTALENHSHKGPPQVQWYVKQDRYIPLQVGDLSSYRMVIYNDESDSWAEAKAVLLDDALWERDPIGTCARINHTHCTDTECMKVFQDLAPGGNKGTVIPTRRSAGGLVGDDTSNAAVQNGMEAIPYYFDVRVQSRPRTYYMVILNCEEEGLHTVSYRDPFELRVSMFNEGGFFTKQFGVDESGILEFCMIMVPIFSIMAGSYICMTYLERKKQGTGAQTHAVVKWFIVIIVLQLCFYMDKLFTYWLIAEYGKGSLTFSVFGYIADVMFLMLIVNFSTGFSALGVDFFSPLKDKQHRNWILIMGGTYFGLALILHIYEYFTYDPMSSDFDHYQTWPAVLLACLCFPVAGYYVYNLRNMILLMPECKQYYLRWGAGFFLYIISLPFLMMLAFVVSPHVKFRCVDILNDLVTVFSMVAMCILLWPGPGLTVTLSNTYTMAEDGIQHMPMTDEVPDTGILNRSFSALRRGGPGDRVQDIQGNQEGRQSRGVEEEMTERVADEDDLVIPMTSAAGVGGSNDDLFLMSS